MRNLELLVSLSRGRFGDIIFSLLCSSHQGLGKMKGSACVCARRARDRNISLLLFLFDGEGLGLKMGTFLLLFISVGRLVVYPLCPSSPSLLYTHPAKYRKMKSIYSSTTTQPPPAIQKRNQYCFRKQEGIIFSFLVRRIEVILLLTYLHSSSILKRCIWREVEVVYHNHIIPRQP